VGVDSAIGIDLSGISRSARGETVAAEVDLEVPLRLVGLHAIGREQAGDRQIVDLVEERRPRVVAIDAPLSLPHSVMCRLRDCPRCVPGRANYLTRDVDALADGMSTSRLAAIAFRGMFLARVLRERGVVVIETYPRAVFRALGVDDTSGKDAAGARGALAARISGVTTSQPDELDAIAAALAAAEYAARAIDGADGTIWRVGAT
jgi:predicted nuclease with RNAse H fold